MEAFNTIIRFLQDGGVFMYPIMIVLALGLAIAIERYIFLSSSERANRKSWEDLLPYLNKGDYQGAAKSTSESKVPISRIINYGLSQLVATRKRNDVETAMEEGLMEVIPSYEKRTHYLATFANIATLLGLLGTIIGLIQAFTAVAAADPSEKADLLSSSISVAMNTTAFGLMAAIPLLIVHAYLTTKTTGIVDNLEMAAVKLLNIVVGQSSKQQG